MYNNTIIISQFTLVSKKTIPNHFEKSVHSLSEVTEFPRPYNMSYAVSLGNYKNFTRQQLFNLAIPVYHWVASGLQDVDIEKAVSKLEL